MVDGDELARDSSLSSHRDGSESVENLSRAGNILTCRLCASNARMGKEMVDYRNELDAIGNQHSRGRIAGSLCLGR